MSEDNFNIEPMASVVSQSQQRFPVVSQLLILGGLFIVIFSTIIMPHAASKHIIATTKQTNKLASLDDSLNTTAITSIGDVNITAKVAYVYDVKAKRVLYNKDADTALPLASITKLMTILIAREVMSGTTTVRVTKAAIAQDGNSGLTPGENISAQSLTDYAVMASSNDSAFALGSAAGSIIGGTDPNRTFVAGMNVRARQLGLTSLKFYNPTGLDISTTQAGAYGSARDVSFLLEYILLHYPNLLDPTTVANGRIYNTAGAYHNAENTDSAISDIPNLLASKTGYTDLAGGNLTIAFDAGYNRPIIVTVLGSTFSDRFSDILTLVKAVNKAFVINK